MAVEKIRLRSEQQDDVVHASSIPSRLPPPPDSDHSS